MPTHVQTPSPKKASSPHKPSSADKAPRPVVQFVTGNPLKTKEIKALLEEDGLILPFDMYVVRSNMPTALHGSRIDRSTRSQNPNHSKPNHLMAQHDLRHPPAGAPRGPNRHRHREDAARGAVRGRARCESMGLAEKGNDGLSPLK